MSKLFLCHSSTDKEFVRKLVDDLNKRSVGVWVDEREILVGDPIRQKIEDGLKTADYLGVVLSPASVQSEWVKKELDAKLIEEIEAKRVMVLPILLKNCEIPPLLKGKLYADFRSDYDTGFTSLIARFQQIDRETEVNRKVLQRLAGDAVSRVDPHQLMTLAVSAREFDGVEELISVHDAGHPGCQAIPQVRAALDVAKYETGPTPESWARAISGAVKLVKSNPVPQHFQILENLCGRAPEDRGCVPTTMDLLAAAMDEMAGTKMQPPAVIAALLIQATHRLSLDDREIIKIVSAAHEIMRTFDRQELRPILSRLLHASTHLVAKLPESRDSKNLLRQIYVAARIKVDRSQEYSDAFLHLAWAGALLGNRHEAAEWLDAYQFTVPTPVFMEKIRRHKPLEEIQPMAQGPNRKQHGKQRAKKHKHVRNH